MADQIITCPNCKTEIKLNEQLAGPLIKATKKEYERKLLQKDTEIAQREEEVRKQLNAVAKAKRSLDEQIEARTKALRLEIAAEEATKARRVLQNELEQASKEVTDLKALVNHRDQKLAEAQKAQAELIRKQRELDDAKRELDLTVEQRVQQSLSAVREKAKLEAEDKLKLRVLEKEQQISSMQRQIEDLQRKAEQGSQQLQGEAQELALEILLRDRFPTDSIEPVPKGEFGGDTLQRVSGPAGQSCGTILWESKRTRNWSDGWLPKLRDDQRAAKADIAVIVSQTVPKGITSFGLIDGVWVTEPRCAIPIAISLRQYLMDLAAARHAGEGQQTKMAMIYQYLTGPRFRHRVEAIVEKFTDMQEDLDRERKSTIRLWAKREAQIAGVIEATAGMYGDLQGIAGRTLCEIEGLQVQLLEAPPNAGDQQE
jgi:hypothetical protein